MSGCGLGRTDLLQASDDDTIESMEAFVKSIAIGSLAGGAPFMLFTVPGAFMFGTEAQPGQTIVELIFGATLIAVSPALLALTFVLPASAILGLPLTALLRRQNLESKAVYVMAGAIGGFLLASAFLWSIGSPDGFWLAFVGAFSGAVTANIWAQERGLDEGYY